MANGGTGCGKANAYFFVFISNTCPFSKSTFLSLL